MCPRRAGCSGTRRSWAAAPSTIWYLAEGSTVIDFNLFYLLQNQQSTPVDVSIRYLRPTAPPIVKTMELPPNSRTTIYVNEADPGLAETDVSRVIESSAPIVVERAMYANRPNQPFALGHAVKGVTTPATTWFLAEGVTGAFFDTYVLIANPSASEAAVEVRFMKPDGSVVTQAHNVAAEPLQHLRRCRAGPRVDARRDVDHVERRREPVRHERGESRHDRSAAEQPHDR